jgi:hypothetical protein
MPTLLSMARSLPRRLQPRLPPPRLQPIGRAAGRQVSQLRRRSASPQPTASLLSRRPSSSGYTLHPRRHRGPPLPAFRVFAVTPYTRKRRTASACVSSSSRTEGLLCLRRKRSSTAALTPEVCCAFPSPPHIAQRPHYSHHHSSIALYPFDWLIPARACDFARLNGGVWACAVSVYLCGMDDSALSAFRSPRCVIAGLGYRDICRLVSVELPCIARGHDCSTVIARFAVMQGSCASWQNIRGELPCEWQRRRGMLRCLAEALKHNDAVLTLHTSHLLHKCYF